MSICVIGACNMDLIAYVPRMPHFGETLHGTRFNIGFGGKGANQAVMASKLGGSVSIVSKVGDDVFGHDTRKNFEKFNIEISNLSMTKEAFTGVAPISVDPIGHNSIVIVNGANDCLTIEEIKNSTAIAKSKMVICQGEIPVEISLEALRMGRKCGATTLFNPAPARADLPAEVYQLSDIFCPNETETEILTGINIDSEEKVAEAARVLLERGPKTVIITLGERGAYLVNSRGKSLIPASHVDKVVDTTGAGDCFIGSLAYFLTSFSDMGDDNMRKAIRLASCTAGMSVQGEGTQTSFPSREEFVDRYPESLE